MAQKSSKPRRRPVAPPAVPRSMPRPRPQQRPNVPAGAAVRDDLRMSEDLGVTYAYVAHDLRRILIIAGLLFAFIIVSPYLF